MGEILRGGRKGGVGKELSGKEVGAALLRKAIRRAEKENISPGCEVGDKTSPDQPETPKPSPPPKEATDRGTGCNLSGENGTRKVYQPGWRWKTRFGFGQLGGRFCRGGGRMSGTSGMEQIGGRALGGERGPCPFSLGKFVGHSPSPRGSWES